jgi:hypothetical protein
MKRSGSAKLERVSRMGGHEKEKGTRRLWRTDGKAQAQTIC